MKYEKGNQPHFSVEFTSNRTMNNYKAIATFHNKTQQEIIEDIRDGKEDGSFEIYEDSQWTMDIHVRPRYKGLGIESQLIAKVCDYLRRKNILNTQQKIYFNSRNKDFFMNLGISLTPMSYKNKRESYITFEKLYKWVQMNRQNYRTQRYKTSRYQNNHEYTPRVIMNVTRSRSKRKL